MKTALIAPPSLAIPFLVRFSRIAGRLLIFGQAFTRATELSDRERTTAFSTVHNGYQQEKPPPPPSAVRAIDSIMRAHPKAAPLPASSR